MSAQVIQIGGDAAIDQAWSDYQRLARAEVDRPGLALDRAHVQAKIRAFDRFQQLYLAGERLADVVPIR